MVSPSDYAIRIRKPNVQNCLFWPASRKNRNENKLKLCFWWISNVSERLNLGLALGYLQIMFGEELLFILYLVPLSLWYDVYCSLQIRNTVWMGDSISRSTEFTGLLSNHTALEKNPDTRLITVLSRWYLFISPAVGRKYIARISRRSLRDYGWFGIYFLPTAGDIKRYHRLRTVISLYNQMRAYVGCSPNQSNKLYLIDLSTEQSTKLWGFRNSAGRFCISILPESCSWALTAQAYKMVITIACVETDNCFCNT